MLNVLKLKAARVRADVPVEKIASELGVNPVTVYRKFDGKTEFTLSEVTILKRLLRLSYEEFDDIFFDPVLTETQDNCDAPANPMTNTQGKEVAN